MAVSFLWSLLLAHLPAIAESRALAYLAQEVPRWSRENKCYSCHNNGAAARALYTAVRLGRMVPPRALEDTSRWLARPEQWDHNGGEGPFSDKKLARLQFAVALREACAAGQVQDHQALRRAAALVAEDQDRDGSWQIDAPGTLGSPTTYGACLATYLAQSVLRSADPRRYRAALARADRWFRKVAINSVLEAAAVLLALEDAADADSIRQRQRCLQLIRVGASKQGGWGPYVNAPPEPFDTALVLLALGRIADRRSVQPLLQRGRAYLIGIQQPDGSWPETTRPAGGESYAQRLSTTGWVTVALLATD